MTRQHRHRPGRPAWTYPTSGNRCSSRTPCCTRCRTYSWCRRFRRPWRQPCNVLGCWKLKQRVSDDSERRTCGHACAFFAKPSYARSRHAARSSCQRATRTRPFELTANSTNNQIIFSITPPALFVTEQTAQTFLRKMRKLGAIPTLMSAKPYTAASKKEARCPLELLWLRRSESNGLPPAYEAGKVPVLHSRKCPKSVKLVCLQRVPANFIACANVGAPLSRFGLWEAFPIWSRTSDPWQDSGASDTRFNANSFIKRSAGFQSRAGFPKCCSRLPQTRHHRQHRLRAMLRLFGQHGIGAVFK